MFRAAAVVCLFASSLAYGQNYLSFVSSTGNDANNCTASYPCATIVGAYNKTNLGGAIHALSNGDFGSLTIGKSITIDGDGYRMRMSQILLDATAQTIILRNITVDNVSSGGAALTGVLRSGLFFSTSTLIVERATFSGNGSGQLMSIGMGSGGAVYMTDVTLLTSGAASIGAYNAIAGTVCNVYLTRFTTEAMSTDGMDIDTCSAEIKDSIFRGAGHTGLYLSSNYGNASAFIKNSVFSGNQTGLQTVYSSAYTTSVKLDGNTFTGNTTGISAGPGTSVVSFRTNAFANNGTDGAPALTTSYR